jgi:hypothetical protein
MRLRTLLTLVILVLTLAGCGGTDYGSGGGSTTTGNDSGKTTTDDSGGMGY